MNLVLTIKRSPEGVSLDQAQHVFGEEGGDIGRAEYNAWALKDPERYISSKHCSIQYEDGVYLDSMEWEGCSPTGPKMGHLSFTPPDPVTEIWIGVADNPAPHVPVKCSKIKLKLGIGTSGEIKSVIINQSGLVYVE